MHTAQGPLTRHIFHKHDDDILHYLNDDGKSIQPKWYVPVIPMVLVNGAEGIGTGWSTSIPNYNPLDIIDNLLGMLDGKDPQVMKPWYMGYTGTIEPIPPQGESFSVTGRYLVNEAEGIIEIFDLGLKKWTDDYKTFLKDALVPPGPEKPALITDYADGTTDTLVHLIIYVNSAQMARLQSEGIAEGLKLTSRLSTSNMVLFNEHGRIQKYANVQEILAAFFSVRLDYYTKRKSSIVAVSTILSPVLFTGICVLESRTRHEYPEQQEPVYYGSDR